MQISRILGTAHCGQRGLGVLGVAALLTSCGLQQDIDVELPAYPAQLVVECYLEPGKVPQLTVTETTEYLADPSPSLPRQVQVVLGGPAGWRDTLRFAPALDPITQKAYTHRGRAPLQARPGDVFTLDVTDEQGRHLTGTATMPALVPIDTVEWKFNDQPEAQRKAYVLVRFQDPPEAGNYYRFQIHRDSVSKDPEVDYNPQDRLNNGREFTLGTSYEFAPNDTLVVTLYHLDKAYADFMQSVDDARGANGNPFAQPAGIKSTVQGGLGVFTVLSYQRRTVVIK
ncbi:DUF4249 domain-containing protein [Hymenobacter lutimineralis]|nr:DUF4249 domain-containing protein [Hymenobacter lutimineralis]